LNDAVDFKSTKLALARYPSVRYRCAWRRAVAENPKYGLRPGSLFLRQIVDIYSEGESLKLRNLLIAVALWLLLVAAIGYWRMFYAWHWGAVWVFFFEYVPILALILIGVLAFEFWFGGQR